jgi:hypothetical protein
MDIGSGQLYKDASGNVGIGTSSPTNKLTISGTAATGATTFLSTGTTTNYNVGQFTNTGGSFYFGLDNNAGTAFTGSSAYGGIVGTGNSTSLGLVTNGSVKVTLDASGNLGLGVTPSAWGSPVKNLDINTTGGFGSYSNGTGSQQVWQTNNAYLNSSLAWTYKYTGVGAFMYNQDAGHKWYTAPSGTAGNAISFTQAMTLDAGGNLGIGTSSPVANSLSISQYKNLAFSWSTGVNYANIFNQANSASLILASGYQLTGTSNGFASSYSGSWSKSAIEVGGGAIKFYVDPATTVAAGTDVTPTERMRIDSSGNVGIGTSSPSASAILDAQSTTKGVRFPNMTTTQKNAISSPVAGLVIFDTTLSKLCVYTGAAWQTITSV